MTLPGEIILSELHGGSEYYLREQLVMLLYLYSEYVISVAFPSYTT